MKAEEEPARRPEHGGDPRRRAALAGCMSLIMGYVASAVLIYGHMP